MSSAVQDASTSSFNAKQAAYETERFTELAGCAHEH